MLHRREKVCRVQGFQLTIFYYPSYSTCLWSNDEWLIYGASIRFLQDFKIRLWCGALNPNDSFFRKCWRNLDTPLWWVCAVWFVLLDSATQTILLIRWKTLSKIYQSFLLLLSVLWLWARAASRSQILVQQAHVTVRNPASQRALRHVAQKKGVKLLAAQSHNTLAPSITPVLPTGHRIFFTCVW